MRQIIQTTTFIALSVLASYSINAQSKIDQTFSGIKQIDISTGSSDCVLKRGTGNEVNVKLEHNFGDKFKPSIEKVGDRLVIKESDNKGSWQGKATWTLTIPDGMEFNSNSGSGDFSATDLKIELSINAGSGDFDLRGINGEVSSNSGSGDLDLRNFSGEINANVGSGDLQVDQAQGEIALNSGSGDIEISNTNARVEANVGSGDIEAKEVALTGKSKFNSGSGDVSVHLAQNLISDIFVNSGSGDAQLDLNGHDFKGTVVMTANKKNGEIHAPFAFDKEEEIDNGPNRVTVKKTARLGNEDIEIRIGTGSGDATISD